jgi:hypothetical protein
MVVYGLSVFIGTPKDQRKGRLRFIIISWIILLASGTDVMIDLWFISRVLLTGGPTGISYLKALPAQYIAVQKPTIASDALLCFAIAVGDILMVGKWENLWLHILTQWCLSRAHQLWRCLVLWKNKTWVVGFPILVFIASIGMLICCVIDNV